jgi:hypothetical protein
MTTIHPSPLLRQALLADAAASAALGLLLAPAAGAMASLLQLPADLLREVGLLLLPWALAVGWLGTRAGPPRAAVRVVIALNGLWVLASALLLVGGWLAPNALGYAFVIGQAVVVLALAELQLFGLRRSGPAAMPA